MKNVNYNDILTELCHIRQKNIRIQDSRKAEVYEKLPVVREIDETLTHRRLETARARIMNRAEAPDTDSISALISKKQELIRQAGYPDDYLSPIYTCPICRDTGYVDGKQCVCFRRMVIRQLYEQSTIEKALSVENFDSFRLDYYPDTPVPGHTYTPYQTMKNTLSWAHGFIDSFKDKRPGILLYGETGTGKTFLTNCIAKELLDRGYTVLYLSAIELFDNILQDVIIKGSSEQHARMVYDYIYDSDFFIIDDLGTEYTNSFVQSQLFEIINKRTIKGQSTLMSTNLNLDGIEKRYTARIMSRIVDSFQMLNLFGDDIRYVKRRRLIEHSTHKEDF